MALHTTGVHPEIAGNTRIDAALLQKKVGRAAFGVWVLFLQRRMFNGYSAMTRRTIKTLIHFDCGNQTKALERALRRLSIAGLVVAERYKRPHTWLLKNGVSRTRLLMVRRVFGDADTDSQFVVPQSVWRSVMAMVTKGGSRAGAGRKKNQKGADPLIKAGTHSDLLSSTDSSPSGKNGGSVEPPSLSVVKLQIRPDLKTCAAAELGPHDFDPSAQLPDFPSFDLLNPAIVPSPPQLNPDDPDAAWALAMVRAYRGALKSRFKVESTAFRRGNVTTSKYLKPLVAAAVLLQQHEIAPASWAAFSCDVWRDYEMGKGKLPSLQWVFSAKRIEAHYDWFKSELSSYTGRRVVFGPTARIVMTRFQTLQMRLRSATDERTARAMVEKEFPHDSYSRLLSAARAEADAERTRLRVAVEMGEWLWR